MKALADIEASPTFLSAVAFVTLALKLSMSIVTVNSVAAPETAEPETVTVRFSASTIGAEKLAAFFPPILAPERVVLPVALISALTT